MKKTLKKKQSEAEEQILNASIREIKSIRVMLPRLIFIIMPVNTLAVL